MYLASILFVVFALMSTIGAYLIGSRFRSRVMGISLAVLVLAFFLALAIALRLMVQQAGAA